MPFISKLPLPQSAGMPPADIYQITIRGANVFLIAGKELTLIDTAFRGSGAALAGSVSELGRSALEISQILLTHNHIDHVGGLAELKQTTRARVALHKADIGERPGRPSAGAGDVSMPLEGEEILDALGGLEVIHTPGHTPGSICLFSPAFRLLIVGDALRKRRDELLLPFRTASYNHGQAIESVRKLSRLDFDFLCFGHGQPLLQDAKARVLKLAQQHAD